MNDGVLRVAVAQLGARRHFAVPAALHREGHLARLFTDLYVPGGVFGAALRAVSRNGAPGWVRRWAGRYEPDLPRELVTAFPLFGLEYKLRARSARSLTDLTRAWLWAGRRFCDLVWRRGLGDATAVYCYSSAALELFQKARAAGIRCILDHATAPKTCEDRLVAAECERFPGWWVSPAENKAAAEYTDRQRAEWELADVIICGSTFVREMIRAEGGPVEKTFVVPLGITRSLEGPKRDGRRQGPLRVLFVGDDGLRKGLSDLAAATVLAPGQVKVKAVGRLTPTVEGRRQLEKHVELVGSVPRPEMSAYYRWADVLALPSVSDTFGLVILEAMSAGIPVIATPNTGAPDVLRDGQEGFIVPIRAPEAIAERLQLLASSADLLAELSQSARRRAECFGPAKYAASLFEAISRDGAKRILSRETTVNSG